MNLTENCYCACIFRQFGALGAHTILFWHTFHNTTQIEVHAKKHLPVHPSSGVKSKKGEEKGV